MRTINEHLVNIFDEGELSREATIRKLRIVRSEGEDTAKNLPKRPVPRKQKPKGDEA